MLGVLFNQLIDFLTTVRGNAKQIFCKCARFGINQTAFLPKRLTYRMGTLASHICLKKHLQNQFAGFAAGTHGKQGAVSYQFVSLQEGAGGNGESLTMLFSSGKLPAFSIWL